MGEYVRSSRLASRAPRSGIHITTDEYGPLAWAGPVALAAGAAAALWLACGTLAVTEASADSRIALPPPLWQLGLLLLLSLLFAVGAIRRRVRLGPLAACAMLILPWLPVSLPAAALVWTGPMVAVLLLFVMSSIVMLWIDERPMSVRGSLLAAAASPRRAPILAAVLAFSLYLSSSWAMRTVRPAGDEPHYLVITQSVLQDGDLQIENNHNQRDYLAYGDFDLKPDFLRRGATGAIYSVHAPGLAVLIAPAFALGGYPGVVMFLALVAALASSLAWRVGLLVSGSAPAAWFAWAAVVLSPPFFFLAGAIYPDAPAAACALLVVWVLLTAETTTAPGEPTPLLSRAWCIVAGIALGLLPWLHSRYAATAALLGLVAAWRLSRTRAIRTRLVLMLVPAVVSAAAWLTFFYVIYGTPNPSAPYGGYLQSQVAFLGTGLPGLLFDQQFGLLCYAPALAVAAGGWLRLARSRDLRWIAVAVAAAVVPPLLLGGAYRMWWGGYSSPGRFAVPGVLVLSMPIAVAWKALETATGRILALLALVASLAMTGLLASAGDGSLVYNARDGYATWLEWLNDVVYLPYGLPSYIRDSRATALLQTAIWVGMLAVAWGALRISERWISRAASIALAPVTIALAIVLAMSSTWRLTGDQPLNPTLSQVALLERLRDRGGPSLIELRSLHWLSGEGTFSAMTIPTFTHRGRVGPPGTYLALPRLPAGEYRLRSERPATADLDLHVGRPWNAGGPRPVGTLRIDSTDATPGGSPASFKLPVDVLDLRITGDHRGRGLGGLSVQPVAPERERAAVDRAIHAARYGDAAVFFFDRSAYPEREGFWIRGASTSAFVVQGRPFDAAQGRPFDAAQGRPAVSLYLRNGPRPNHVTVRADDLNESMTMNPGEERLLTLPTAGRDAIRIGITSEGSFRPSTFEPPSTDVRELGVWVGFR